MSPRNIASSYTHDAGWCFCRGGRAGGWEEDAREASRLAPYLRARPAVVLPDRGAVVARIRYPQVRDAPAVALAARARDGRPVVVGAVKVDEGVVPAAAAGRSGVARPTCHLPGRRGAKEGFAALHSTDTASLPVTVHSRSPHQKSWSSIRRTATWTRSPSYFVECLQSRPPDRPDCAATLHQEKRTRARQLARV